MKSAARVIRASGILALLSTLSAGVGAQTTEPPKAAEAPNPAEAPKPAAVPAPASPAPFNASTVAPVLAEPVTPLPVAPSLEGRLDVKGKRLFVAEFRVLYDIGGEVSASTRAGYLPGRDYGATRVRVKYNVPAVDVAAFQAITEKAYADFRARAESAGVKIEDGEAFVRTNGAVYETTESPSAPGAPVILEAKNGRKYLVTAPAGMKLHSRGFAGLGAGNIGKRIEWTRNNLEGLSISLAVNVAALESSGSGSSILRRESSASASEGMSLDNGPDFNVIQTHANVQMLRLGKPVPVEGNFAVFREVGGYDSRKDPAARIAGVISNLGGLGANQSKRVELEVDLDGPSTARLALRGLASMNQALVDRLK